VPNVVSFKKRRTKKIHGKNIPENSRKRITENSRKEFKKIPENS